MGGTRGDREHPPESRVMRKVIFVGIHNKPGMKPLDSRTKTGRLVDLIIEGLSPIVFTAVKSNLWEVDPSSERDAFAKWAKRVDLDPGRDIVVLLGGQVTKQFAVEHYTTRVVAIPHPSHVWSYLNQKEYVKAAIEKIKIEL